MKKLMLAMLLTSAAMPSLADDVAHKVNTVKQLYTKSGLTNGNTSLKRLATPDLKTLFTTADRATPDGELGCIDYVVSQQGQDYDEREILRTLKINALSNGNVQVRFKNFGENVNLQYKLICSTNGCKIDDVLQNNGRSSFKQQVRQCLRG